MLIFRRMLTRVGRFQSYCVAYVQGLCNLVSVEPSIRLALKSLSSVLLSFVRSCFSSQLTHLYLLFVAVCCSKCILLSSSSCLTLALEENTGRNAAGGPEEEEEGSNRDRGRGPLFRNSAGLEYLCCTFSVHH